MLDLFKDDAKKAGEAAGKAFRETADMADYSNDYRNLTTILEPSTEMVEVGKMFRKTGMDLSDALETLREAIETQQDRPIVIEITGDMAAHLEAHQLQQERAL